MQWDIDMDGLITFIIFVLMLWAVTNPDEFGRHAGKIAKSFNAEICEKQALAAYNGDTPDE